MGRSPCCDDQIGLKKGPWTTEEDHKLVDYITRHGHGSWRALPKLAGLNRCGKSCRLRWTNYLRPDIKRGKFEEEEERIIINLHSVLGNKWSKIATHLPGRTDNEIKNYWNTHLRKKLLQMGIDPNTHKPRTDLNHLLSLSQLLSAAANVGNMMSPWDNALRLQADAAQLAKMQLLQHLYMQVVNSSAPPNIDMNTGLVGSKNLNPFGGHVKGASTMPRGQEGNPEGVPGAANDFNSISNSLADFESGFDAEGLDSNNKNLSSFCDVQIKNPFPNLVSASPGTFTTTTQMEIMSGDPAAYLSTHSPTTMFEDWEKLMDDETSESYWKDIIESMS